MEKHTKTSSSLPKHDTVAAASAVQRHDNNSSSNNDKSNNHHYNGIADYFAILGIGDNLQFKKATKTKPHDDSPKEESLQHDSQYEKEKEEQCQMMQRFYREIVHVGILSVYTAAAAPAAGTTTAAMEDTWNTCGARSAEGGRGVENYVRGGGSGSGGNGTVGNDYCNHNHSHDGDNKDDFYTYSRCDSRTIIYAAHLATSHRRGYKDGDDENINNDNNDENNNNDKNDDDDENNNDNHHYTTVPLVPLLHLHTQSGIGMGENDIGDFVARDVLPEQVDGFQILYNTVPASAPNDPQGHGQYHHQQQQQQQQGHDISLNMSSLSMNTTFDGSLLSKEDHPDCENGALGGDLWSKGQTFRANLHFHQGYRGKLLSHFMESSSLLSRSLSMVDDSLDATKPSNSHNHSNNKMSLVQREQNGNLFLSKLPRRPTLSKLGQNIFSPILHHSHRSQDEKNVLLQNGCGVDSHDCITGKKSHDLFTIQKKEFYVGYKKRDPDETDLPGIADCKIVYCRIHKETILPEKKDLSKRLRIIRDGVHYGVGGAGAGAGAGGEKSHQIELETIDSQNRGTTQGIFKSMHKAKNSGTKSKTTVAVMKKSLLATAEIAKNVVSQGRDRLRKAAVPGMMNDAMPPLHTKEETVDEVTHGNVDSSIAPFGKEHDLRFCSHAAVYEVVNLDDLLDIPEGYDEWVIPEMYQQIRFPVPPSPSNRSPRNRTSSCFALDESRGHWSKSKPYFQTQGESKDENRMQRTFLSSSCESPSNEDAGIGIEAYIGANMCLNPSTKCYNEPLGISQRNPWSPVKEQPKSFQDERFPSQFEPYFQRGPIMPVIIEDGSMPLSDVTESSCEHYDYVPLLVLRRQRIRNEERFHEDPSIIDLGITFVGFRGDPVLPVQEEDFEDNENDDPILGMSPWTSQVFLCNGKSKNLGLKDECTKQDDNSAFGTPHIVMRRNVPLGFLDTPFATSVLDRFPKKDYKGLPLPEEELPMFCYPTGCRLIRSKYQDAPLPEHYGFVVKNERGDSIYVSCISFVESLTPSKQHQLNEISKSRVITSLPHRAYWEQQEKSVNKCTEDESSLLVGFDEVENSKNSLQGVQFLTGFDDIMTFEYKTICIISRYPFWSAFRRFLSHLHILSGSSSDIPLERYISHLMLSVPVPKPGGQCILVPLPAVASPMVIGLPPLKDFPILDLSFRRLFSCLDVPTVVTIVLGFLALERKVIIMSTYPSLVSDACELLKSLLFPFELCAPYVPRLTEPFMSCLEFPGAIFAGIHDDRSEDGLAASVRKLIPEDTFIVDLDTGDIDCNGERFDVLKECWEIIPSNARSLLVEEIETLCHDANLTPGQEPPGSELEAALDTADVSFAPIFEEEDILQLDDRAIRDAFLRFYCYILGGYERFLLVPDIDFVVSGNEWFDTKGFLASVEKQNRSAYLHSFLSTQLFQSFIQRRTEASDVQCLLFDECLAEYHSSQESFGRMTDVVGLSDSKPFAVRYQLLVDRCAAEFSSVLELDESSSAETSILTAHTAEGFMINNTGDLVTVPSKRNLPPGHRYVYCIDGHPHFPEEMDIEMFYPKEPDILSAEFGNVPVPILIRSDRELEVSNRRKKLSASRRGVHMQRRCLFQLPKLMGSHVLNSWLMCIPFQVAQQFRSLDQQNIYLVRALGALRLMRSRHRIVPDEAGYRCLIVACGRVQSDRRQDVAKLFGLLRSDGIFPSAVTLGQYTKSIAEGYSKHVSGKAISSNGESLHIPGFPCTDDVDERLRNLHAPNAFDFLDRNLLNLDKIGSRWRKGRESRNKEVVHASDQLDNHCSNRTIASGDAASKSILRYEQEWMPVSSSSSFSPHWKPPDQIDDTFDLVRDFRFIALWSRTTICDSCQHELLDEEIQAGWDEESDDDDNTSAKLNCPCCGALVHPRLGYIEMAPSNKNFFKVKNKSGTQVNSNLPAQICNNLCRRDMNDEANDERLGYVPYLSPSRMRRILEQVVDDFGENILDREKLRYLNPTIFFNLWWFCCRFSLPLPLAISTVCSEASIDDGAPVYNNHCCAFAAWDKSTAIAACDSASKTILTLQNTIKKINRPIAAPEFKKLVKTFQNQKTSGIMEANHCDGRENPRNSHSILQDKFPLLANLNFHALGRCDWENDYLSKILVKLVEACDKRDFYPALEAVLQCNEERRSQSGGDKKTIEFDCYRTLLYLTRYQCTSAFHKFFPTTTKTCKGYHFWCPNATVSIFDRLFREAMERLRAEGNENAVHDISDVALGFRSVFGHII